MTSSRRPTKVNTTTSVQKNCNPRFGLSNVVFLWIFVSLNLMLVRHTSTNVGVY